MFKVENFVVGGAGKRKTPMIEESLRRPTPTLSKLFCLRKGTLFVATLLRFGVVYSSWSIVIIFPRWGNHKI
jgi:hypothetical protein